ncbi:MAG: laccase domain-containing protein, partial [Bdellovibrionales bacterium]|nr:laccase domain-containing protein [Bdellovibrionales bacterium]
RLQLESRGVGRDRILLSNSCTISSSKYFSFRRQKDLSGRQVSFVICA